MVIQKQTLQLPHLRRMSLNYFVLRNTKRKLFLIFIYILRDREKTCLLTQKTWSGILTLAAEHVWGLLALLVPKPYTGKHCKAKKRTKITHDFNCTKYIKYYHPRLNFMHFIISNTKVSSFVLELCTSLPRNRMCVCVCAGVVLRLL